MVAYRILADGRPKVSPYCLTKAPVGIADQPAKFLFIKFLINSRKLNPRPCIHSNSLHIQAPSKRRRQNIRPHSAEYDRDWDLYYTPHQNSPDAATSYGSWRHDIPDYWDSYDKL